MLKIIDTHTHVYLEDYDADRAKIIQAAKKSGIAAILLPNIDPTSVERLFHLCDIEPDFAFAMMGLHPTSVDSSYASSLKQTESLLTRHTYCGIGEIGIDLYWNQCFLKEQKEVFEEQLRWSIDMQLPVAIHTRNAFPEVFDSIYKIGKDLLRGVFHCFSGTLEELEEIKQLKNFKIGINGVVTFKNSPLAEILRQTPLDMILLETDAPYLAPAPYRGKRNEPFFLWEVAKKLASIYEINLTEVANHTTKNTLEVFNISTKLTHIEQNLQICM